MRSYQPLPSLLVGVGIGDEFVQLGAEDLAHRLTRGPLPEYSVPTYQGMGETPRAGNDSGGGQLGNAIHCKPHGANDWLYVVVQEAVPEAGLMGRLWDAMRLWIK